MQGTTTSLTGQAQQLMDNFQPREIEFILFLADILTANPNYSNVTVERALGARLRADLTAIRNLDEGKQSLIIEARSGSFLRHRQIKQAIEQIGYYRKIESFDAAAVAFPGRISKDDQAAFRVANIEVWDLDYIAETFSKEIGSLPTSELKELYSIATNYQPIKLPEILLNQLHGCIPGQENSTEYQKIIANIFEVLFKPPLERHIWESPDGSKTNRRDIIFPNYAFEGFWKFLRESYRADFIVVEAKNYKNKIKKPQILQVANYLKPHGAGMFAIIACREGGDASCQRTLREQWAAYRKLIIILNDNDIEAMLHAAGSHGKPEEVIGQVIQEFRLSM